MKLLLFIPLCILITSKFSAQLTNEQIKNIISSGDESQLLKENSRLLYEGFYFQADMLMDKLLNFQPENANYNYRKGFLLLEMNQDYRNAIPFFEKSILKTKKIFDAFNTNEDYAPIDAHYHLGKCYHMDGQLEKAEQHYKLFLDNSNTKSELVEYAQLGIMQCYNARNEMKSPDKVLLTNLGSNVNTSDNEYSSVVSLDGSSIYFTSKRPWLNNETEEFRDFRKGLLPEDVYVSKSENNGQWSTSQRLDFCEAGRNEASLGVSVNERYIYLYQDAIGSGDLYFSDLYNPTFEKISNIEQPKINSEFWETHLMMTADGNTIFFASDRPGGYGGLDLYVMSKINGIWSESLNLGANINSAFDEDAPFITSDGNTLYFASNGPSSIGGFDILISSKNVDGTWGEAKNAGYPFNSTNDDIYFSCTIDGKRGFLTSSRPNGVGGTDIYEIVNDQFGITSQFNLLGKIRNANGKELPKDFAVNMELKCTDCDKSNAVLIFPRLSDGVFKAALEPCKNYELYYYSSTTKKILYQSNFKTSCSATEELIEKEVILDANTPSILPVLMYKIEGLIAEANSGAQISNASISVRSSNGELIENVTSDSKGNFKLNFLNGKKAGEKISFEITVSANGYLNKTISVDQKLGNDETIALTFNLDKISIGSDLAKSFGVKSIYFDFNKYNLRKDAIKELDKIIKIMNDNPTLKVEFGAHTDCTGPEIYNQYLSDMRAKAVENYIKAKISNPDRITGKGYGETEPAKACSCDDINKSCTTTENQANRRAVFKVIQK
jgi:outer membrane protein OmpA-like peptidoglycan-associated protein/tetratricopeptide (TPR) repeat protein